MNRGLPVEVVRVKVLTAEAAPSGRRNLLSQSSQLVGSVIEGRVAVGGALREDTVAGALVVLVLVNGPRRTSRHNQRPSKVVIVEGRGISVEVLLSTHEVLPVVEVDGVVFVTIWSSSQPDGRCLLVKDGLEVCAIVFTPSVKFGRLVTVLVVVDLVKQDPDAVEATGGDPVVEVEWAHSQVGDIVSNRDSVSGLVRSVVADDALLGVVAFQLRVHQGAAGRLPGLQPGSDGHSDNSEENDS